jgi:hypothetical protein
MKIARPGACVGVLCERCVNELALRDGGASARNSNGPKPRINELEKDEFALRAQFAVTPLRETALGIGGPWRMFDVMNTLSRAAALSLSAA